MDEKKVKKKIAQSLAWAIFKVVAAVFIRKMKRIHYPKKEEKTNKKINLNFR